jgi:hypothetical protein
MAVIAGVPVPVIVIGRASVYATPLRMQLLMQVSFDVIAIEADGTNVEKDRAVIMLLGGKGYEYAGHVVRNDWFVRRGFQRQSQSATNPVTPDSQASSALKITRPSWLSDTSVMRRFQTQDTPWVASTLPALAQPHAQDGEDTHAYMNYFFGRGGGSFMEMGALDGTHLSNTFAFDRELGWKGIHIEASPSSYEQLAANRPDQVRLRDVMDASGCL